MATQSISSRVEGFPQSSVGKESFCNAGDPSLIPGLGRSPGEENGYPLQCSGLENARWGITPGASVGLLTCRGLEVHPSPGDRVTAGAVFRAPGLGSPVPSPESAAEAP